MLKKLILLCLISLLGNLSNHAQELHWKKIFNGKNLKGWHPKIHHHKYNENYANTFSVKDCTIVVNYDGYQEFNERFGHLFYKKSYSHYKLKLKYRFIGTWRKDAPNYIALNSGVMFHSQPPKSILKEQNWPISVEMQFLANLPNGAKRPTGNMCSPGTNIYYKGKPFPEHCLDSSSPNFEPSEWVEAELTVLGDSLIEHRINGQLVLTYTKPSIGGNMINQANPKYFIEGKALKIGFIGLQSEGQPVQFKDIYLAVLKN